MKGKGTLYWTTPSFLKAFTMSAPVKISNAKGVAIDGRLHNVRTRHVHLSKLFTCLQESKESLVKATLDSFSKLTRKVVDLSLECVLRDIQYEASQLDENKTNSQHQLMAESGKTATHLLTTPVGTVGVAGFGIQFNPIAGILGPTVAAIASGNAVVVLLEDSSFRKAIGDLFRSALDREAYSIMTGTESQLQSLYPLFDKVVTYRGAQNSLVNSLAISSFKSNLVVVDQSIVDESVYRVKGRKPTSRQLRNLHQAVDRIVAALELSPLSLTSILVSENIREPFDRLLRNASKGLSCPPVTSYRSTEHVMEELNQRQADLSSVYIFGDLHQAAYLSRYTKHLSCILNALPLEVVIGYIPSEGSIQQRQEQHGTSSLSLKPLWPTSLFSYQVSTLSVPLSRIEKEAVAAATSQSTKPTSLPIMKRRKPKHLEFFPTGFKLTAFPTLLTILGLTGYGTFRAGLAAFRLGKQYYDSH